MSVSVQVSEAIPRRNVMLVLVGSAVLFSILQFGVTWLAMQIGIVFLMYPFRGIY